LGWLLWRRFEKVGQTKRRSLTSRYRQDSGATVLDSYRYNGAGRIAREGVGPVTLDYYGGTAGLYAGFDRFGRVVKHQWIKTSDSAFRDGYAYGYDRASNRLWRENLDTATSGKDELYAYDDLNRLTDARRGDLNANKDALTSTGFRQNWTLDALGNWGGFKQDTSGDGTTWGLQQSRTHNKVNEIDTDDNHANGPDEAAVTEGQGQAAWVGAKYDAAGNTLQGPKPGAETTRHKYVYDAWNPTKRGTRSAERGARSTRPHPAPGGALFSIRSPQSAIGRTPSTIGSPGW